MAISLQSFVDKSEFLYLTRRNGHPVPVYMSGPVGEGKSSAITRQLPTHLEDHFWPGTDPVELNLPAGMTQSPGGKVIVIDEKLSTMEPMDMRGIQLPLKNPETGKHENTFLTPELVNREKMAYALGAKIVIIFLDEFAQCDNMTQKAAAPLILEYRIGDHGLAKTTWIIGAGNRQQDGAGAGKMLSLLNNRWTMFEVYNEFDGYLKRLKDIGAPAIMHDFADFAVPQFATAQPTKDGPFLSKRSFEAAALHIGTYKKLHKIDDPNAVPDCPILWAAIAGDIGESTTHELKAFIQAREHLPKPEEILRNPETAKVPDMANIAAHYAASRLLASMVTATNVDTLWKYAMRLRRELVVRTANTMMSNPAINNVLFNAPTFMQWQADPENRALVQASMTKV